MSSLESGSSEIPPDFYLANIDIVDMFTERARRIGTVPVRDVATSQEPSSSSPEEFSLVYAGEEPVKVTRNPIPKVGQDI